MDGSCRRESLPATPVAGLARLPEWSVSAARGWWVTAERVVWAQGRRWLIGLTPAAKGLTALMLWRDDEILLHHRGMEAELCALAQNWADNLLIGRPLDTAS